jgi:hypothetical protein
MDLLLFPQGIVTTVTQYENTNTSVLIISLIRAGEILKTKGSPAIPFS